MARYLNIYVAGEPRAQQRPRFSTRNGFVKTYDPEKSRDAKALIGMMARHELGNQPMLEGDLMLALTVNKLPPKSWSKKKQAEAIGKGITSKPDLDNYIKLVLDALNGVWFRDDSCIASIMARKKWSKDKEGMLIMVSEIITEHREDEDQESD